jgi:hypothetical protein
MYLVGGEMSDSSPVLVTPDPGINQLKLIDTVVSIFLFLHGVSQLSVNVTKYPR